MLFLFGLGLVACTHDDSTTSESLQASITASNPAFPASMQTIRVQTSLVTYVDYANAVSRPTALLMANSGSYHPQQVTPDSISLTLDSQRVSCQLPDCSYQWDPASVADGVHTFVAVVTYQRLSATATLSWTLDRRPATFVSLGPPPPLGYTGLGPAAQDVAVAVGADGEPLVLSTQLLDPSSSSPLLGLAHWDGGSWGVTYLGSAQALRPSLVVDATGTVWAAWDEPGGPTVKRSDGGAWEVVDAGLPPTVHGPRLASAGSAVYLALTDGTVPVRRFENGVWVPVAPPLQPPRFPIAVRLVVPGGSPVVALEEIDGGAVVELLQSVDGGPWTPVTTPLMLAQGTGGAPEPHLVDLIARTDGTLVVAGTDDAANVLVAWASPPGWASFSYPGVPYFKAFATGGNPLLRSPAAMAAVPDGGIALLLPAESDAMALRSWDGAAWTAPSGPLRARLGAATVLTPALVYDAAGRPLGAWQQSGTQGSTLEVWWP